MNLFKLLDKHPEMRKEMIWRNSDGRSLSLMVQFGAQLTVHEGRLFAQVARQQMLVFSKGTQLAEAAHKSSQTQKLTAVNAL